MSDVASLPAQGQVDPTALAAFYLIQKLFTHLLEKDLLQRDAAVSLLRSAALDASAVMNSLSSPEHGQASEMLRGYADFIDQSFFEDQGQNLIPLS